MRPIAGGGTCTPVLDCAVRPLTFGEPVPWAPDILPPGWRGPIPCSLLQPDRKGHIAPGSVLLTLKPAQVDGRYRKRRVVEEGANVLD